MKNKINTSDGLVTFISPDGREVSINPTHVGWSVYQDTISFFVVGLPVKSGHAIMASRYQDLEFNGTTYQSIDALEEAVGESVVAAGAVLRTEVVEELPESGTSGTIYLVPKEGEDGYDEYIWIDDDESFEQIGDTSIDLSDYYTKEEVDAKLEKPSVSGHTIVFPAAGASVNNHTLRIL